jgi:phage gp45-like
MHHATPYNSSFRAYTSGGARATVSSVDDGKQMQEVSASFMKGEKRSGIETPHMYGFATVPFDPDKDKDGKETGGPECFMSFIGGNRSFPVSGPIDDRRHRLKGLEKGDNALFRGRDDAQQFLLHKAGNFMSAKAGKVNRIALVSGNSKNQAEDAKFAALMAASEAQGGEGASQPQKPMGQNSLQEDNAKSTTFFEQSDKHSMLQQEPQKAFRVTKDRIYMRFGAFAVWIDSNGIHSTHPITLLPLPED